MVPGTSRYLYDYAEPMRSEILDLLTLGLGHTRSPRGHQTWSDPRQQCSTLAASNGHGKSRPVPGGHRAPKVCSKLRRIHPGWCSRPGRWPEPPWPVHPCNILSSITLNMPGAESGDWRRCTDWVSRLNTDWVAAIEIDMGWGDGPHGEGMACQGWIMLNPWAAQNTQAANEKS